MTQNVLSEVMPWDLVADGYVEETAPIFIKWAMDAIGRVNPKSGDAAIDIATGPGTVALQLSPRVRKVAALDFSQKMISHLDQTIRQKGIKNIEAKVCDCQSLPYEEGMFDCAFSQFGLMFFPDRVKGFQEMRRVLKPGGKAAVYSWAPISESSAMTLMMGALAVGFPQAKKKDIGDKKVVFGLDNLDVFRSEMEQAGFKEIAFESVTHEFPQTDPESFWKRMAKGSAPIVLMKNTLAPAIWAEREKACIEYLRKNMPNHPTSSTAFLGIGVK